MSTPPTLEVPTISRLSEAGKVSLMGNAIPQRIITDAVNPGKIAPYVSNLSRVHSVFVRRWFFSL